MAVLDRAATRRIGILAGLLFLACVPLSNWMIQHVGACAPDGPCVLPVAPGLAAPSGVITVGVALVLRDLLQRCCGTLWAVLAILLGAAFSLLLAPPMLALASCVAFLLSELVDFAIYTPLQRRRLVLAVIAAAIAGTVVDSFVFLTIAFHSLDFMAGQVVGKLWAVLVSLPLVRLMRRVAPTDPLPHA